MKTCRQKGGECTKRQVFGLSLSQLLSLYVLHLCNTSAVGVVRLLRFFSPNVHSWSYSWLMIYFTRLNSCNEAVKGGQHREIHPTRIGGTKRERCEGEVGGWGNKSTWWMAHFKVSGCRAADVRIWFCSPLPRLSCLPSVHCELFIPPSLQLSLPPLSPLSLIPQPSSSSLLLMVTTKRSLHPHYTHSSSLITE